MDLSFLSGRGLAPKRRAAPTSELDPNELKELLGRGKTERDRIDVERQEGLGAAPYVVQLSKWMLYLSISKWTLYLSIYLQGKRP